MRPQRRARSRSSVSYVEGLSDDDFSPSIATHKQRKHENQGQSTAAIKRKERPNPKERAEAMQLERAIKESLSDVVYIDQEPCTSTGATPSAAFQCLLDVTYGEEASRSSDAGQELAAPKSGLSALADDRHNDKPSPVVPEQQPESGTEGVDRWKQSFLDDDIKRQVHLNVDEISGEEALHEMNSNSEAEDFYSEAHNDQDGSLPAAKSEQQFSTDTGVLKRPKEATNMETMSRKAPRKSAECTKGESSLESPKTSGTLLPGRRRVIGLSKRFKPPSLHPYLTS